MRDPEEPRIGDGSIDPTHADQTTDGPDDIQSLGHALAQLRRQARAEVPRPPPARIGKPQPGPDDAELIDLVYAVGDAHAKSRAMKLHFLSYLLAMALQEALTEIRAGEASA